MYKTKCVPTTEFQLTDQSCQHYILQRVFFLNLANIVVHCSETERV